ncbi:Hypothetical predicted protein [Mytilus galloprovincialis]|uniref:Tyr recombinase domain-containing protein n=2 Tax=Mytilus galloprovincialis TaxID=29158 RepID=A0A8B6E9W7_MYTGA|nr:Hypothetical predicted protein [Mytilus galloprovincialis]
MGPIRKKKNNNAVYNPTLLENWTIARLKAELERKNIAFPINAKRLTLVRILKRYENSDSITSNTTNARGEEARGEDSHTRGEEPLNGSAVYHHALPQQNARVDGDPRSQDAPNTNNNENTPSNDNRVLIGIVSKLSSTVQSLQQNVSGLTGKGQSWSNFNLQSAYNALQNTRTAPNAAAGSEEQLLNMGNSGNMVRTAHGYSAETLPFVETISPQLRKNIISGMDINLTSLLIPYYSGSGTHELSLSEDKNNKSDPRSSRSLSLGEFIQAFGIYKNIMCTTFPHRRSELDLYERDLVDMATRYSGITTLPSKSIECKNLRSALSQPTHVLKLIETEVEKGYLEGPFDFIPFTHYRINPIGVAEGKYNKKKRLIVDLSAPHEDPKNPSLNELIDKDEFSLQYVSIDDAIRTIKSLGFKSWLLKTDIADAFKKTEGPCHKLEYLGIFLDTINMEAYLPLEKVLRIQEIIEYFSKRNSCTKRELLSLLGHLNFACRVIVPGRSFVSHLIKLSTTVKKLHHHVHLKSCKPDLVMWSKFLKDWNGVSFFLNDNITNAADIHLFTDATPSSFGGFYQNEWFQDDEVQSLGTTCKRDTNSLSASLRADDGLNLKIDELWDASLSESTRLTYKSAFKCFRTFLVMNGQPCSEVNLPYVKEDLLVYFVTYCQKALNLKHQTIKLYLAGVRHYYIRFLGYDPMANAIRLPVILRGIKKSQNNVVQERLPITSSILNKLCALLSKGIFSPVLDLMFQCAFKMAFFGFLRCGEFTCRSYNDNSCTVLLQDITVDPTKQFFIFRLRSSKRDPFRQGVNITIYENDTFKPVDTMNKYLSIRYNNGALPKSPLFVEDEFQSSPLSRETFISSLRQLLDTLGYNTVKFCGHSFRIGAATSAAACGVEDHIIQTLGRWSSDCYIRYIRTDAKVLKRAQHDMCFHN